MMKRSVGSFMSASPRPKNIGGAFLFILGAAAGGEDDGRIVLWCSTVLGGGLRGPFGFEFVLIIVGRSDLDLRPVLLPLIFRPSLALWRTGRLGMNKIVGLFDDVGYKPLEPSSRAAAGVSGVRGVSGMLGEMRPV